jgi:hypothetical protein
MSTCSELRPRIQNRHKLMGAQQKCFDMEENFEVACWSGVNGGTRRIEDNSVRSLVHPEAGDDGNDKTDNRGATLVCADAVVR